MAQIIVYHMTGQLPVPPYTAVYWNVFGQPDPTGAQSGYGAGYLINVSIVYASIDGSPIDPVSGQVGGDLTGYLPNPYVSGIQGKPVVTTTPTSGQVLQYNGTSWAPTNVAVPSENVGGDLSGTLPNPTVIKIQGQAVSSQTPSSNQILTWSGTEWIGNTLTLAGDVTGSPTSNSVSSLQGVLLTANSPTSGQIISYNGTRWIQTTPGVPVATTASTTSTPNTLALRDGTGATQFGTSGNDSLQIGGGLVAGPRNATFGLSQTTQQADFATNDTIIESQAPFASATGTNRLPGDITINIPLAAGALATTNSGNIHFAFDGNPMVSVYQLPLTGNGVIEFPNDGGMQNCTFIHSNTMEMYVNGSNNIYGTPLGLISTGDMNLQADNIITITGSSGITIDDAGGFGLNLNSGGGSVTVTSAGWTMNTGIQFETAVLGSYSIQPNGDNVASSVGANIELAAADNTGAASTGGDAIIRGGNGTSINGNIGLGGIPSAGGGSRVIFIANRTNPPGSNPTGGGILYCEAGALKFRGSSGTVSTIAPA